ncbi:MAG: TMEM165/GDT1 family protein [Methylococcaceae bacterium]|nr:TMEM165/GDT1 family protein [Methylococcaceae bacterium]
MATILQYLQDSFFYLSTLNLLDLSATASTSFILIAAAEIGDKSQLVCMTLATRHRATPIVLGAITAFAFLNSLAVLFGSAIANWVPDYIVSAIVALLFAIFGIHSLRIEEDEEEDEIIEKSGHNIFFTTFLLITVAEFGDKTQLAVVALSSTTLPIAVWIGATCALAFTSALGVLAGRTVLQKCPLTLLHKISGSIFLILAVIAAYNAYLSYIILN